MKSNRANRLTEPRQIIREVATGVKGQSIGLSQTLTRARLEIQWRCELACALVLISFATMLFRAISIRAPDPRASGRLGKRSRRR